MFKVNQTFLLPCWQMKYENLLNGTQQIESSLHKNLVEHLNAEIVLNTITDISVAVEWLKYTFLYIRVMKNPAHYGSISTFIFYTLIRLQKFDWFLFSLSWQNPQYYLYEHLNWKMACMQLIVKTLNFEWVVSSCYVQLNLTYWFICVAHLWFHSKITEALIWQFV